MNTSGLYENYNARHATPEQIAQSFIYTEHFAKLALCRNSLVTGPRGSGKTTMLKMLQDRALDAWSGDVAMRFKKSIKYSGVFIPYDRLWETQASPTTGEELAIYRTKLERTAIVSSSMMALLNAFIYKLEGGAASNDSSECRGAAIRLTGSEMGGFIKELSSRWSVTPIALSLLSLKSAIAGRMMEIREIGNKVYEEGTSLTAVEDRILRSDLMSTIIAGIELFDAITGGKCPIWALLFDEMELAPEWLQKHILANMRSANQKLIIKMSLCPLDVGALVSGNPSDPQPRDDYDNIELWYAHKADGTAFSTALVSALLREKDVKSADTDVFGFDRLSGNDGSGQKGVAQQVSYRSDGYLFSAINSLIAKDRSFAEYCERKKFSLKTLDGLTKKKRAEFRKNAAHIIVRENYLSDPGQSVVDLEHASADQDIASEPRNVRNIPKIYTGIPTLYWLTEGNPRWTIGFFSELLLSIDQGRVKDVYQIRAIREYIHKFRMKMKSFPCPREINGIQLKRGLLDFIDILGGFFRDQCNGQKYNDNLYTFFQVDSTSYNSDLKEVIKTCIRVGALVHVPKNVESTNASIESSIIGSHFRLSYLLSPFYRTPPMMNRYISIKKIFEFHKKTASDSFTVFDEQDKAVGIAVQHRLFSDE